MANYRNIHCQIWRDPWFMDLGPVERYLFIYLFSNEASSMTGLYHLDRRIIRFESGLDDEELDAILAKFEQADKVYYRDGVVWVVNMQKYNALNMGSELVRKRIAKDVALLDPGHSLRIAYEKHYADEPYHVDTLSVPPDTISIPPPPLSLSDTSTPTPTSTAAVADASSAPNDANPAATAISKSLASYVYTTIDEGMGWNLSPNGLEEIGVLIDEYPRRKWWDYALRECVISQARNLRYLNKCLATAQKRSQPIKPVMIREKRAPPPIEWGQVLETLYSMQTRASVDMWLGSATVEIIDTTLIIAPSTRNARDWITNRMAASITDAVGQLGDDWHWKLKEADDDGE